METIPCSIPVNVGFNVPSKVSLTNNPEATIVNVGGVEVGGSGIVVIAGPCAVENHEQLFETARSVNKSGARILRGGAFKPRSSPYSFQGMGEEGLKLLSSVRNETRLPVVTEVMDTRQVEIGSRLCRYAAGRVQEYAELPAA